MPLDQSQLDKLQSHFQRTGVRANCQACGANNWNVGEMVTAPTFSSGGIALGGPTVPMVQVICGKCGNIMHFAAVLVGLAQ